MWKKQQHFVAKKENIGILIEKRGKNDNILWWEKSS